MRFVNLSQRWSFEKDDMGRRLSVTVPNGMSSATQFIPIVGDIEPVSIHTVMDSDGRLVFSGFNEKQALKARDSGPNRVINSSEPQLMLNGFRVRLTNPKQNKPRVFVITPGIDLSNDVLLLAGISAGSSVRVGLSKYSTTDTVLRTCIGRSAAEAAVVLAPGETLAFEASNGSNYFRIHAFTYDGKNVVKQVLGPKQWEGRRKHYQAERAVLAQMAKAS